MPKPSIFFSHSSLDKSFMSLLREKLLRKTSRTIEVFQSSDGESIPFGNNWVHKIEENLEKARIMFVFISPKSLTANWLYFESGFAYAKKIKVIPVGIKGVDVGEISPPLNLLQGFNISSEEGFNNVLTVINREFGTAFEETFTAEDYVDLVAIDKDNTTPIFKHLNFIDYVWFGFPAKIGKDESESALEKEPLKVVQGALERMGIRSSSSTTEMLHSYGMTFQAINSGMHSRMVIRIDPHRFVSCAPIVNTLFASLYPDLKVRKFWFKLIFDGSIKLETTDYKVSFRLQKHGIEMHEKNGRFYQYKNLIFNLEAAGKDYELREVNEENLHVVFEPNDFDPCEVLELVELLVEAELISKVEPYLGSTAR